MPQLEAIESEDKDLPAMGSFPQHEPEQGSRQGCQHEEHAEHDRHKEC